MATSEAIPVLHIKAKSNYDVGFSIGRTYRDNIASYVSSTTGKIVQDFYRSSQGRKTYDQALASTTTCFPHIVEEIRGMAEGCGLPFEVLFLNNIVSDILTVHAYNKAISKEKNQEIAGCTDILVNTEQCRLLAHNEDWEDDVDNISFLVDVEIDKSSQRVENVGLEGEELGISKTLSLRDERYLAFLFPGSLAGNAFYLNRDFAITIDSLLPSGFNDGAVPVDILLRALVGCKTIEECMMVMKNEPVGSSYGIGVNIASRKSNNMWSLEVYPDNGKTIVDVQQIPFLSKSEKPMHYVHANHYKHMERAQELPRTRGSLAREKIAYSMATPRNICDVCNILGDQSGDVESIYKVTGKSLYNLKVKTIATAVFDMNDSKLHIFLKNPKDSTEPSVVLPFV